jgi:alpha-tubulin suppressor-like RCC1 family protein
VTFQAAVAVTVSNTGIVVPEKAIGQLAAGKRAPVLVTVNGYEYGTRFPRTSAPMRT